MLGLIIKMKTGLIVSRKIYKENEKFFLRMASLLIWFLNAILFTELKELYFVVAVKGIEFVTLLNIEGRQ